MSGQENTDSVAAGDYRPSSSGPGPRFRFTSDELDLGGGITLPVKSLEARDGGERWPIRRARVMVGEIELSMIWGTGTYSDNYEAYINPSSFVEQPFTIEIMTISGKLPHDEEEPLGWVSVDRFLRLIGAAKGADR